MTHDEIKMLDELLGYDPGEGQYRMSPWEINFIERFNVKGRGWYMTAAQADKLQEIWRKCYG